MKNVLSIQSSVVYGYAGNKSAVFPMQLLGIDVWPFYTVQFSNHTQYNKWKGMVIPTGQLTDIIQGLESIDKLKECDAILSGYIGDRNQCDEIIQAVEKVRQHNPDALYFCDPVMNNPAKNCIVAEGVEDFFLNEALHYADIIGPNLYELGLLTGKTLSNIDDVILAAHQLINKGVKKVLVKHLSYCGLKQDAFEMLLVTEKQVLHIGRPLYPFKESPVGVGDLTCSILLANLLNGKSDIDAFEHTANAINDVMSITHSVNSYELKLIEARHHIMEPIIKYSATIR